MIEFTHKCLPTYPCGFSKALHFVLNTTKKSTRLYKLTLRAPSGCTFRFSMYTDCAVLFHFSSVFSQIGNLTAIIVLSSKASIVLSSYIGTWKIEIIILPLNHLRQVSLLKQRTTPSFACSFGLTNIVCGACKCYLKQFPDDSITFRWPLITELCVNVSASFCQMCAAPTSPLWWCACTTASTSPVKLLIHSILSK